MKIGLTRTATHFLNQKQWAKRAGAEMIPNLSNTLQPRCSNRWDQNRLLQICLSKGRIKDKEIHTTTALPSSKKSILSKMRLINLTNPKVRTPICPNQECMATEKVKDRQPTLNIISQDPKKENECNSHRWIEELNNLNYIWTTTTTRFRWVFTIIHWATRRYSVSSIRLATKCKRFRIAEGSCMTMSKCKATGIRSCQFLHSINLNKLSNQTVNQPTEPMDLWVLRKLRGHGGQLVARTHTMMERLQTTTESQRQMVKEQALHTGNRETRRTNSTNQGACTNKSQRTSMKQSWLRTWSKTSTPFMARASMKKKETKCSRNLMTGRNTNPSQKSLVSHLTWRNQDPERQEWKKNMETTETEEKETSMSCRQGATWTMWIRSIRTQARSS